MLNQKLVNLSNHSNLSKPSLSTISSQKESSSTVKLSLDSNVSQNNRENNLRTLSYKKLSKDEERKEVEKILSFYRTSDAKKMFNGVKVNGKLVNTQKGRSIELDKFTDDIRAKLSSLKSRYSREEILESMNRKILEDTQPKSVIDQYFNIENKQERNEFLDNVIKTKMRNDQQMYTKYLDQMKEDSKVFTVADYDHGHDDENK